MFEFQRVVPSHLAVTDMMNVQRVFLLYMTDVPVTHLGYDYLVVESQIIYTLVTRCKVIYAITTADFTIFHFGG